ncbi:hypothetical protein V8E51_003757 [Hyaloscypha variabilis]
MLPPKVEPAMITNSATKSSETEAVTTTTIGKAVCPPSSIPAMPIISPIPQIDLYPKMLDRVIFPT